MKAQQNQQGEKRVANLNAAIALHAGVIESLQDHAATLLAIGDRLVRALRAGHKLLTAGNGGSAAEAMHMAEELVGRYRADRRSLPAVALTADGTALTCIGNDYGFDRVFSRQVEGLARRGDMLVLFSTSGRAVNLQQALAAARARGVHTVCLLGRNGGALAGRADQEIIIRDTDTARIQEAHQVILHLLLEQVDAAFAH